MDEVSKNMTIEELIDFSSRYNQILYKFEWENNIGYANVTRNHGQAITIQKVNAFSLLMRANDNNQKPEKILNPKTGRDKLRNYVTDYIINLKRARFSKTESHISNAIINCITNILWSIDGHQYKFIDAPNVPQIPKPFRIEKPMRATHHDGIKKKKLPNLCRERLVKSIDELGLLLVKTWMRQERFHEIKLDISSLKNVLMKYCDYLENKNREIAENHRSIIPIRTIQTQGSFQLKHLKSLIK